MPEKLPPIILFFRFYFNTIGLVFGKSSVNWLLRIFSTPRVRVFRTKEIEILNSANKTFIEVDGDRIKIYEWGKGNKLVMLFHGWESNAGSLGAFVKPLIEKGHRIIAFDAPAHGGSGGKQSNLIYFKKAAKAVIEQFGIPKIAIGHSLGACSIIMAAYEEQLNFEKVILIAPLNRLMTVFEEYQAIIKIPESLFKPFISRFEELTGYQFDSFYFHNFGRKTELKNVLLFHDTNDRITNFSHAKEFEQNWGYIKLNPIKGSGHYKVLWNEEVVSKSMKYLEN